VVDMLEEVMQRIKKPSERAAQALQQSPVSLQGVEGDIREIKETLKAMAAKGPKTWAQVVGAPANTANVAPGWRERQEKLRRVKAKTEVLITTRNANEEIKQKINTMNEAQITAGLKDMMTRGKGNPDNVLMVRKINHGLRIRCTTEQAAKELRAQVWKAAFGGSEVIKPQYGVVVHGASKLDVNFDTQKPEEINKQIGDLNETVNVKRVAPLRKRTRKPNAETQSIIIFTEDPAEADRCIDNGIYIGEQRHAAERYMPQCKIKQCFNCQGYGHTAGSCTRKKTCGNCGKEHETRECKDEEAHCVQCQGSHPAWHHECPARKKESARLESMRDELSTHFTK